MHHVKVALVLLLFTVLGVAQHWRVNGDDLTSTYIACRLLATGQQSHLYSYDPNNFDLVGDPLWTAIGRAEGVPRLADIHPYVQTPIWAALLRPVCTHTDFPAFYHVFIVVLMLSTSGTLWLVAKRWAPTMYHPGWLICICAGLYISEPFKYALFLAQTHMLFIFLTILALMLADGRKEILAGTLLACAAAVKITPVILLLYWIVRGRWRAALSCVLALGCFAALSIDLVGFSLLRESLATYQQLANVLLLAMNNESFAAWTMAYKYPATALLDWSPFPLPSIFKIAAVSLSSVAAVAGARADRGINSDISAAPYGAVFVLVAATVLNPIAWSHYFIILVIPAILFLDRRRNGGSIGWSILAIVLLGLSLYPTSHGAVVTLLHKYPGSHVIPYIVRGEFSSSILCLAALWYAWRHRPLLKIAKETPYMNEPSAVRGDSPAPGHGPPEHLPSSCHSKPAGTPDNIKDATAKL
jgi:hypothetical protein